MTKKNVKTMKGFTLVEVIVVMVILAILAALMVPSLTKYIDKANDQSMTVEARYCVTALQTFCSDQYGQNKKTGSSLITAIENDLSDTSKSEIMAMAEVPGEITAYAVSGSKIVSFTYENGDKTIHWAYAKEGTDGTYSNHFSKVDEAIADFTKDLTVYGSDNTKTYAKSE